MARINLLFHDHPLPTLTRIAHKGGEMVIYLSPIKYELFLRRITQDSPARVTLAKAREIDFHPSSKLANRWVIVCDRPKATALHNAATQCCPEALAEIEIAFKHDRFYWM